MCEKQLFQERLEARMHCHSLRREGGVHLYREKAPGRRHYGRENNFMTQPYLYSEEKCAKITYVYVKLKRSHFVGTELWPDPRTRENFWSFKINPSLLGTNLTEIRAFEVESWKNTILRKKGLKFLRKKSKVSTSHFHFH